MGATINRRDFLSGQRSAAPPPADADGHDVPVALDLASCLVRRGVVCRACGDACDARAIRFRLLPRGLADISLDHNLCTGCGDCVPRCPVGAISLNPQSRQVTT